MRSAILDMIFLHKDYKAVYPAIQSQRVTCNGSLYHIEASTCTRVRVVQAVIHGYEKTQGR